MTDPDLRAAITEALADPDIDVTLAACLRGALVRLDELDRPAGRVEIIPLTDDDDVPPEDEPEAVVDLLGALQRSLDAARETRRRSR